MNTTDQLTPRQRVQRAMAHQEADRVPFDLGGMAQSGIHRIAYEKLRSYLNLPQIDTRILNINTQQAEIDFYLQDRLGIDVHLVYSQWANPAKAKLTRQGVYWQYFDEWGVGRRMPVKDGNYYDLFYSPLAVDNPEAKLQELIMPDINDTQRYQLLRAQAEQAHRLNRYVVLMGLCPGIVEMVTWLRGFENFFTDLASNPQRIEMLLDIMVEQKITYWQRALEETGEFVDAVNEADDLAGQNNLLLSPRSYRKIIKPYHQRLIDGIRQASPHVKIIFHSCGAIRPLIPDFIELGIDALNPIQMTASKMNLYELKQEFGKDLVFWGGGVDSQHLLAVGTESQINEHVRKNIEILAPGGGFIFAPTHIIQPDVPPENIMMMVKAFQQYSA